MDKPDSLPHETDPARSFGQVADAYDRARPSYPKEAVDWLAGAPGSRVLELGAGTGKLTEQLVGLPRDVVATDPSEQMLRLLRKRVPGAPIALSTAESIPLASQSVDVVVSAQAFHWFDTARAVPEIARVLRPSGVLGLVWNERDQRIPWVRRLGDLIGPTSETDPTNALIGSQHFGFVERASFRFWQPLDQDSLRDLVVSRSNIAVLEDPERTEVLARVDELYDEYGRGADGMLLPYVTHAFRASVKPRRPATPDAVGPDDLDTDSLLIDFR